MGEDRKASEFACIDSADKYLVSDSPAAFVHNFADMLFYAGMRQNDEIVNRFYALLFKNWKN